MLLGELYFCLFLVPYYGLIGCLDIHFWTISQELLVQLFLCFAHITCKRSGVFGGNVAFTYFWFSTIYDIYGRISLNYIKAPSL